jgi:hypothetical protein
MTISTQFPGGQSPNLYINGFTITNDSTTPNTMIDIGAGAARDSTNVNDIVVNTTTSIINTAVNGLNGLDTGTLAASTWYAIWAISSSNNKASPGFLLSLSYTAPTLPFAYDSIRRIGSVLTDGSSHILKFYSFGARGAPIVFWDAVFTSLNAAGHASTYSAVSLATAIPPSSQVAIINWALTPATAGNTALLRPTGSASTTNQQLTGSVAAKANAGQLWLNTNASQSIDYITTSGSDALTLYTAGYLESL